MLLDDILDLKVFSLPYSLSEKDDFITSLSQLLEEYYKNIDSSAKLNASFTEISFDRDAFLNDLREIIDAIIRSLNAYLEGFPAKAYSEFDGYLVSSNLFNYLAKNKRLYVPKKSHFYRIRADKFISETPTPLQLFHIPFELRRRVATQRYSIPGFPCLYLSNTMEVAWRELNKPEIKKIKAIAYRNITRLKIIDMVPMDIGLWKDKKAKAATLYDRTNVDQELYYYALAWPLIAACHLKVEYKDPAAFKAEYVMPQLLLQWLVQYDATVEGVRYFSAKAYFAKGYIDHYFNYVMPVKQMASTGYCNYLLNIFLKTKAINAAKIKFKRATQKNPDDRSIKKLQYIQDFLLGSKFTTF